MKFKTKLFSTGLIALSFILNFSCSSEQNNWPQFRGPDNNMIAPGTNYADNWNDSLNIKWTYDMTGESWSSPIIYGDKVFITTAVQEKTNPAEEESAVSTEPETEDDDFIKEVYRWEITCIDLNSGKELWKQVPYQGHPKIKKHSRSTYACESPVTDGKRVYAYFGMTGVYCYDLDGKLLWEKDMDVYKTRNDWGSGTSPAIYKNNLYLQVDNEESSFLMALDAETGNEIWRVERDEKTNYSTPVIWENSAGTELVTVGTTARSNDPETGSLNWELKIGGQMAVSSPVYDKDHIYLGLSGENNKQGVLYAIKAGAKDDISPLDSSLVSSGVEWTLREAGISNASPLLYNGLLYLISGRSGELSCIDPITGELIYKEKIDKMGAVWASNWAFDNKIYSYNDKGVTHVVQAGREFKLLSQNTLNDNVWASVAFSSDAYIFKGVKKIYCVKK